MFKHESVGEKLMTTMIKLVYAVAIPAPTSLVPLLASAREPLFPRPSLHLLPSNAREKLKSCYLSDGDVQPLDERLCLAFCGREEGKRPGSIVTASERNA